MRWGIRNQVVLPMVMLLAGVALVSGITALNSSKRSWARVQRQVRNVGQVLGSASFPLTERVLEQMKGLSGAEYLFRDAKNRITTTLSDISAAELARVQVRRNWHELDLDRQVIVADQPYLCAGLDVLPPSGQSSGTLYILYPEALWQDTRWEAIRPSLLVAGFVSLASLALATRLATSLAKRVRRLVEHTRRIASGDFRPDPLAGKNDELRDLGHSINQMAAEIAKLQQALLSNERLRLLDQLSGGLAHQLRNGVTGATLAVQVHARECDNQADPESLEVALRELALLEATLKRFLELGRPDPVPHQGCSLNEIVKGAIALIRPRCRHANTELICHVPGHEISVFGNPGQLGQVCLNLLNNAIDAAGPQGRVALQLRDLSDGSEPHNAVLEISDSGAGPAPEIGNRLFEPFATTKKEGVGLGLAVARKVAENHGGHLSWERENGQTCFRLVLPLMATRMV